VRTGRPRMGGLAPCTQCGAQFYRAANQIRKFCSWPCYHQYKKLRNDRVNEQDGTVRCARCRKWKPIADYVMVRSRGKPRSYCKACDSVYFHEMRGTPAAKRKPYRPAYRLTEEEKRVNKRERNRLAHHARRAAGPAPSKSELADLLRAQRERCAYCLTQISDDSFHIDHKMPVSRGGTNAIENLQYTCPRCNMLKGAMTDEEFLVSKKRPQPMAIA
jgi:5-methylcytosine-specific restriction endonuclease McrA